MWILEASGDLFHNKRIWLRPGNTFILGRTKQDEPARGQQFFRIEAKSVSRKHLIISIGETRPEDAGDLQKRSQLEVRDESKLGTTLKGLDVKINQESRVLDQLSNEIQLGSYEQIIKISWCPVVLSGALKGVKTNQAAGLQQLYERLGSYDIKVVQAYVVDHTTHAVDSKRNTPRGLQALVNGKYIVTQGFVDALEAACKPADVASNGEVLSSSPLEEDFDRNFPNAAKFLPPAGREPNPRPASYFAPDPRRLELFQGFTFIFGDAAQYELLHPPLISAGGKCLLFEIEMGVTSVNEFAQRVREASGSKGVRTKDDRSADSVVVVRFRSKGPTEQWAIDFIQELDSILGQRSIEQNEFLDAILSCDTSIFVQPLEEQPHVPSSAPLPSTTIPKPTERQTRERNPVPRTDLQNQAEPQSNDSSARSLANAGASTSKESEDSSLAAGRRRPQQTRNAARSRFEDFDNYDGSMKDVDAPSAPDEETSRHNSISARNDVNMDQSQGLFVTDKSPSPVRLTRAKKRPLPPSEKFKQDDLALVDELLPGARAMKKRRLEDGFAMPNESPAKPRATSTIKEEAGIKKSTRQTNMDIRQAFKQHAQDLDRKTAAGESYAAKPTSKSMSRRDFEAPDPDHGEGNPYDEDGGEEEIRKMRDLALVEEMELPHLSGERKPRPASSSRRNGTTTRNQAAQEHDPPLKINGREWRPEWNDRPNFKGFRRSRRPFANDTGCDSPASHGQSTAADSRQSGSTRRKVLVPLEEVRRKDYGLDDSYYFERTSSRHQAARIEQLSTSFTRTENVSNEADRDDGHRVEADDDDDDDVVMATASQPDPTDDVTGKGTGAAQDNPIVFDSEGDANADAQTTKSNVVVARNTRTMRRAGAKAAAAVASQETLDAAAKKRKAGRAATQQSEAKRQRTSRAGQSKQPTQTLSSPGSSPAKTRVVQTRLVPRAGEAPSSSRLGRVGDSAKSDDSSDEDDLRFRLRK